MSDTLERFHAVLVQEIRENRPEYLETPFTVAEIYQNLVPYRTHRDRLGVEMNGDYEHALLRLLGGEGDYLELDSDVARRQIRDELEHPNPNTGLFRDFAAADVRLTAAHREVPSASRDVTDLLDEADSAMNEAPVPTDPGEPAEDSESDAEEELAEAPLLDAAADNDGESRRIFVMSGADTEGEDGVDEALDAEFDPEDPTVHAFGGDLETAREELGAKEPAADAGEEQDERAGEDTCHWCRADLPERNVLNFCPYCGSDLGVAPCAECGEELESAWMFCPACGTEAAH